MSIDKKMTLVALAWFAIGALCGFFMGKGIYQPTFDEKVARDTVYVRDTVPDYQPAPVDSARVRYITRYLPVVKRGVDHFIDTNNMVVTENVVAESFSANSVNDSVLVEVPITSKHYQSKDYDAWVSGYEPSLDSIFVYREKEIITETITRTVKDSKHFFLDVGAGCEYQFNGKTVVPFAELGLRFKKGKLCIGAYGGYTHDMKENKASPTVKAKVTYDILGF